MGGLLGGDVARVDGSAGVPEEGVDRDDGAADITVISAASRTSVLSVKSTARFNRKDSKEEVRGEDDGAGTNVADSVSSQPRRVILLRAQSRVKYTVVTRP